MRDLVAAIHEQNYKFGDFLESPPFTTLGATSLKFRLEHTKPLILLAFTSI